MMKNNTSSSSMWRLLVLAGLLVVAASAANTEVKTPEEKTQEEVVKDTPEKRSPQRATGVYGAAPQSQQQYVTLRQVPAEEAQEQQLAPEYLALLQQYLEAQPQARPQPPPPQQQQHVSRARLSALIEQELARLGERPLQPAPTAPQHQQALKHHQAIPLEVEQYHIETSQPLQHQPQRPIPQQLYYPVEEQPRPQHHQPRVLAPTTPAPVNIQHEVEPEPLPAQPQGLRYHQSVPIQYGYSDEGQVREQQQNPESIVRAQAQAEAAALAFQKVAQASHYKHQNEALEQIRLANEKHAQQSALEQIRQGDPQAVSEAGLKERIQPKDPEGAYKARLKAQATALVAEQRRAHEAAEYKAHADAILKLQAQQRAHLRAQEEAHRYALNFEKNQKIAQEQAQAIANAQALALYKARQQALAKAQAEAKHAARAQHEARKNDENAPVVQYLLPNKVPLPAPEVYLPKAEEALRAQAAAAAQEKRLKKPIQPPLKHLVLEEIDPQLLRRVPVKPGEEPQQLAFIVDAGYIRKHQHQQQHPQAIPHQRQLLRPNDYETLEEVQVSPRPRYQQYQHQQIDAQKLALLVPIEPQSP